MKVLLGFLLTLIAFAVTVAASAAPGPARMIELQATADSWVEEQTPELNHGSELDLIARFDQGKGTRILLAFGLTQVKEAHIQAAQLQLNLQEATGPPVVKMAASGLSGSWTESVSWDRQPERTPTYDTRDVAGTPGLATWDVTTLLQDTIEAKDTLDGVALSGPIIGASEPYSRRFAAREAGQEGPRLLIEFVPGAAVRSAPPGAGPTGAEEITPRGTTAVRIGLAGLGGLVLAVAVFVALRLRRAGLSKSE